MLINTWYKGVERTGRYCIRARGREYGPSIVKFGLLSTILLRIAGKIVRLRVTVRLRRIPWNLCPARAPFGISGLLSGSYHLLQWEGQVGY